VGMWNKTSYLPTCTKAHNILGTPLILGKISAHVPSEHKQVLKVPVVVH